MAVKIAARKRNRRVAKVAAPKRRGAVKISARKKKPAQQRQSTRPRRNAFTREALALLEEQRQMLTVCATRGFLNAETVSARRFVITHFVNALKRKGKADSKTLHRVVVKLSDEARASLVTNAAQPKLTYKGPKALERRMAAREHMRDAAVATMMRSVFAKKLYETVCKEAFVPPPPSAYTRWARATGFKPATL